MQENSKKIDSIYNLNLFNIPDKIIVNFKLQDIYFAVFFFCWLVKIPLDKEIIILQFIINNF